MSGKSIGGTMMTGNYRASILRVTGFVFITSCLLLIGLKWWEPAYWLWYAMMNVSLLLYLPILLTLGFLGEALFGPSSDQVDETWLTWIPTLGIVVFLQILQGILTEVVWQGIKKWRKYRRSKRRSADDL